MYTWDWIENQQDRNHNGNTTPGLDVFMIGEARYYVKELDKTFISNFSYTGTSWEYGFLNEEYIQNWADYHLERAKHRFLMEHSVIEDFIDESKIIIDFEAVTYPPVDTFKKSLPKYSRDAHGQHLKMVEELRKRKYTQFKENIRRKYGKEQ